MSRRFGTQTAAPHRVLSKLSRGHWRSRRSGEVWERVWLCLSGAGQSSGWAGSRQGWKVIKGSEERGERRRIWGSTEGSDTSDKEKIRAWKCRWGFRKWQHWSTSLAHYPAPRKRMKAGKQAQPVHLHSGREFPSRKAFLGYREGWEELSDRTLAHSNLQEPAPPKQNKIYSLKAN